ncbi:MAG: glycoside hydrolase family 2 [Oscillospiraceae bacterium]|jgi:beta-galactosidase/beta-glucuronidase|nr:glycoside hydrolase family 2 [Oscillospiraceae bacterium]
MESKPNLREKIRLAKLKRHQNVPLYTSRGNALDRNNPLPEYPRPQFERQSCLNLNGVWEYAITRQSAPPEQLHGEIVVPFSPESLLSGVGKILHPDETLHYKRIFAVPADFLHAVTYLHFGAVDCDCTVTLNGRSVGAHSGGFLPFSLNVTDAIRAGENEIRLAVTDPTDTSYISRGKQSSKPGGIWYTPQSGIWQTVWLESVPSDHITSLKVSPDIDRGGIVVELNTAPQNLAVRVRILDGETQVASVQINSGTAQLIKIPEPKLWTPETPFLYNMQLTAGTDSVRSYFGMRKFSVAADKNGVPRLCLNNQPYFHNGLLDQGYWSDGLLTAPSDDALIWDIETMKRLGFNMLRKHIKIEPLRWYYHCDRLGMLVWQDMMNGGGEPDWNVISSIPFLGKVLGDGAESYARFGRTNADGRALYKRELAAMLEHLHNAVSIAMWVPFNEGWGQFDATEAAAYVKESDPSRTVDHASGWHDQGGGDVASIHVYFKKLPLPVFADGKWNVENPAQPSPAPRPLVLSEFGGYSYHTPGHVYNPSRAFGYKKFKSPEKFRAAYERLCRDQLRPMIDAGLSAAVYTQVSDVEDETNGLVTFDREVCKLEL